MCVLDGLGLVKVHTYLLGFVTRELVFFVPPCFPSFSFSSILLESLGSVRSPSYGHFSSVSSSAVIRRDQLYTKNETPIRMHGRCTTDLERGDAVFG